jgi:hypothetical protein
MRANILIAAISAAAAIFGALAGGAATYVTTRQAQRAEDARHERQVDRELRGAARFVVTELTDALDYSKQAAEDPNGPPPFIPQFAVEVAPEDVRLVISGLTSKQYRDVAGALSLTRSVQLLVRRSSQSKPLPSLIRALARSDVVAIQRAVRALRPVAELSSGVPDVS